MESATTKIYGDVSPETVSALETLRAQSRDLVYQLGQLELEKARVLGRFQGVESKAQEILMEEGNRLDIPDGTPWKVVNGKAVEVVVANLVNPQEE